MALPIQAHRGRILEALKDSGALVLTAPTGSGKSTGLPRFLLEERAAFPGRVLVLEPRRIAARGLAARVAQEAGTPLGRGVGYQVRFESRCGKDTAVVFQTYGVFIQQMLGAPGLPGVGTVLLDEFHERTLECDLALAWLKRLRSQGSPRLAVLSATLDAQALLGYLPGARHLDVPGRQFPVDVRHQPLAGRRDPAEGALAALRELSREGLDGSVLVFMPGMREIRRTLTLLGPFCRERKLPLLALHGSMELSEQQKALEPSAEKRVIVSTNVAETSLTLPGVSAVIDSGLHRIAGYSPSRGVNTLHLARISRRNAEQRAGRAGRTMPGRCVRLWTHGEEASMPEALAPEMLRLELSPLRLQAASLPEALDWLTPPREDAWAAAGACLRSLGAEDEGGRITPHGRALLRYPASPRLASVLERSRRLGSAAFERACAMAAVFETSAERRTDRTADLSALAESLLLGEREEFPWEAGEVHRQLMRMGEPEPGGEEGSLHSLWLEAFADRLAARQADSLVYRTAEGVKAHLPLDKGAPAPGLLLALDVRERAGAGQARQVSVTLYLPCPAEAVKKLYPAECEWKEVSEIDERIGRVVKEERLLFRGLVIERRQAQSARGDRKAAAGLWAERFASGELRHPGLEETEQLVVRIRLARRLYPDYGFPAMDPDDWRLVYEELCSGRGSLKEIEKASLSAQVARYAGPALMGFLDKALPLRRKLPSGRLGRFTYFESRPPELSARLGDFLKMTGTLSLCEGRMNVLFDILAPNGRTVQKTHDLGSFWKNTYPAVKKELARKYPKHPWP
ncbi:MAG TPA: hypothetical protein DCM05_15760 [Elusimicrobia bacterium]|nr:hypothetical protein [Elusimicrobiota bacterium]